MLALTRKHSEANHTSDEIKITIMSNDGNQVGIGIGALREVAVHHSEAYEQVRAKSVE